MSVLKSHRNTILVEDARVISNTAYASGQHVIRIHAPKITERALPGQFIHIRCGPSLQMRRPMSIMRAHRASGDLEFLFKIHGQGSALLADAKEQQILSVMGPIGKPFRLKDYKPHAVLIGGGVGIPPMIYLAEHLRQFDVKTMVFMGSEIPFPFTPKPSQILVEGLAGDTIACMPLLEDWGIPSRLATTQNFPGCYDGYVTALAEQWIVQQTGLTNADIEVFACGPTAMLKAVVAVAEKHSLTNQVSLEEYMACAVGGCAGCTVLTTTPDGNKMQRVCVDGPVFDGNCVVFQ